MSIAAALCMAAACGQPHKAPSSATGEATEAAPLSSGTVGVASAPAVPGASASYDDRILEAAKEYGQWPRVDERAGSAPWLCAWWPPTPSYAQRSTVTASTDHGKKLYFLHATDRERYVGLRERETPIPVGFAIVKEAYHSVRLDQETILRLATHPELRLDREGKYYRVIGNGVRTLHDPADQQEYGIPPELVAALPQLEITPAGAPFRAEQGTDLDPGDRGGPMLPPVRVVEVDGHLVRTGEQADLFVMAKVAASALPGTDAGWVYGVVKPDRSTVLASGNLEKCAHCHASAGHERLFGSARPPPGPWDTRQLTK
jgi:hypothetical protein